VGQCLPLYLDNRLLLSALEDEDVLPADIDDDRKLLSQFRERASEQAVMVLEELYGMLFGGNTGTVPYRTDRRRLHARTVREHWYIEGHIFRKHEKNPHAYWNLYLGCLCDKGPAVGLVFGPQDDGSTHVFDALCLQVAPVIGIESANPRTCFTHKSGYKAGVIAAFAQLGAGRQYADLAEDLKTRSDAFFTKFRSDFESAIDG
jgi:hypothetical protein